MISREWAMTPPLFVSDVPLARPALPDDFGVGSPVVVIRPGVGRTRKYSVLDGVVEECARVWCTIKVADWPARQRLRLDTQDEGKRNGGWSSQLRFRTVAQHRWDEAHDAAIRFLSEEKIRVEYGSPWHHKEIMLARLLWSGIPRTE